MGALVNNNIVTHLGEVKTTQEVVNECISKVYCKAKQQSCLGRLLKDYNLLLKKLVLAKYLAERGEGYVLGCFLSKNCN